VLQELENDDPDDREDVWLELSFSIRWVVPGDVSPSEGKVTKQSELPLDKSVLQELEDDEPDDTSSHVLGTSWRNSFMFTSNPGLLDTASSIFVRRLATRPWEEH